MASLQLRIDDNLKKEATALYAQFGLDLNSAIRMFLTRSVEERGIPFRTKLDREVRATSAVSAMKRMSEAAKQARISEMSLTDINKEISASRKQRKGK